MMNSPKVSDHAIEEAKKTLSLGLFPNTLSTEQ